MYARHVSRDVRARNKLGCHLTVQCGWISLLQEVHSILKRYNTGDCRVHQIMLHKYEGKRPKDERLESQPRNRDL